MAESRYLILIRGINVGGKNTIPMEKLKECLMNEGFSDVTTYIASGNVMLTSDKKPERIKDIIEKALPKYFKLESDLIKVRVLTGLELKELIHNKPKGFGDAPEKYHSDVIFLIDADVKDVMPIFDPREGVDSIWEGKTVVYSQRLSEALPKSRLSKIIMSPYYKSMTIRSWSTVTKLLDLLEKQS